jgi:hypothetical protein
MDNWVNRECCFLTAFGKQALRRNLAQLSCYLILIIGPKTKNKGRRHAFSKQEGIIFSYIYSIKEIS